VTIKIAIPGRPSLRRTTSSVGVDQHKEWTDQSVAMDITGHKTASVFKRLQHLVDRIMGVRHEEREYLPLLNGVWKRGLREAAERARLTSGFAMKRVVTTFR